MDAPPVKNKRYYLLMRLYGTKPHGMLVVKIDKQFRETVQARQQAFVRATNASPGPPRLTFDEGMFPTILFDREVQYWFAYDHEVRDDRLVLSRSYGMEFLPWEVEASEMRVTATGFSYKVRLYGPDHEVVKTNEVPYEFLDNAGIEHT